MLVLSREPGQKFIITVGPSAVPTEFTIAYLGIRNGDGRIGFEAPRSVRILRAELKDDGREMGGAA